jgi:hypothetical protein
MSDLECLDFTVLVEVEAAAIMVRVVSIAIVSQQITGTTALIRKQSYRLATAFKVDLPPLPVV